MWDKPGQGYIQLHNELVTRTWWIEIASHPFDRHRGMVTDFAKNTFYSHLRHRSFLYTRPERLIRNPVYWCMHDVSAGGLPLTTCHHRLGQHINMFTEFAATQNQINRSHNHSSHVHIPTSSMQNNSLDNWGNGVECSIDSIGYDSIPRQPCVLLPEWVCHQSICLY